MNETQAKLLKELNGIVDMAAKLSKTMQTYDYETFCVAVDSLKKRAISIVEELGISARG